ncbi:tautomerase family protein [Mycobacterium asiaticum]|uniref:Tautomerase n=1 Tax=Mycobacterium asiaticum TaxID=1790 RepID=A0A1A3P3T8_MYCAS|nr:tautomerase family protein [Mycobacterium asiaticum]OBK27247.1 tautomerase [Mycobacterium asiaticum]OBK93983.1 tautomerase [Mycobacterium asiaticum]
MPIYTCTTAVSTLDAQTKAELAAEITRIHSRVNHVPSTYINVVFQELPPDAVYTDAQQSKPLLISGWVRTGHPDGETSQLLTEVAEAATRVTGIPSARILVIIQNSPAHFAMEGGRVLPNPGEEQAWLAGH